MAAGGHGVVPPVRRCRPGLEPFAGSRRPWPLAGGADPLYPA